MSGLGRGTRGKQSVERHTKGASTTRKKADDDDFPCAELREFIRYGVTPQRSHDRRRQMQNDAWEAYLSEVGLICDKGLMVTESNFI